MTFRIDSEFKDYLGALDGESKQALEESLMAEGCRDALVVWPQADGDAILLDGHNRHEICVDLGISFRVVECPVPIADREGAVAWIVRNQRARRNLTPDRLAYLRGKVYRVERAEHGGTGANQYKMQSPQNGNSAPAEKTCERVAKEFGVSKNTILRNAAFSEAVDDIATEHGPEAKAGILDGRAKVSDYRAPLYADVEDQPEIQPPPPVEIQRPAPPAPASMIKRSSQSGYDMIARLREYAEGIRALPDLGLPSAATEPAVKTCIFHIREALYALERHLNQEPEE